MCFKWIIICLNPDIDVVGPVTSINVYVVGPVTSIACPPAPDDIAIIMYTSGSSGKPKVCTLYNAQCTIVHLYNYY